MFKTIMAALAASLLTLAACGGADTAPINEPAPAPAGDELGEPVTPADETPADPAATEPTTEPPVDPTATPGEGDEVPVEGDDVEGDDVEGGDVPEADDAE